jgi:heterotetrameric sarcosine oxidase delta subunit
MLIPCPHCGNRDENEFDYGGRAVDLPELSADASQWHQALHLPDTGKNIVDEYWFHAAGCECWISLQRCLSTHVFIEGNSKTDEGDC